MTENGKEGPGKKRSPEAIQQRKNAVLVAAAGEFATNGYSAADMDRIAETARVGKGTIYRYYGSKEKLFEAVADNAMDQLLDFLLSALHQAEGSGPFEQFKSVGRAFLEFFDRRQALLEVFLRGGSQFRERMERRYLQLYGENVHIILHLLEACIGQGLIRKIDAGRLTDVVGDMLIGLIYMWGVRKEKTPLSQKWPFVEMILLEGILAR